MTEQELEFKRDMEEEMKQDAYEEEQTRLDLDYAMDRLGIADIHKQCEELANKLVTYGHDVSIADVIEYLEEI